MSRTIFLAGRVEHQLRSRRQEREPLLDVALEPAPAAPGEGAVANVEAELAAMLTDEVERRQHRLAPRAAQTAAELLQEDRRALRRAEEQHRVDLREVEALVEEVGGEEAVHLAVSPLLQGTGPGGGRCLPETARLGSRHR